MIDDTSKSKPAPEKLDERSIPSRDDVHVRGAGLRCPFCHDGVDVGATEAWVACEKCLARHHGACWGEAGRCGGCGHDVALTGRLRPEPAARPRGPRLLWIVLAVAALTGLMLMVAAMVAYTRLRTEAEHEQSLRMVKDLYDLADLAADVSRRKEAAEETRKREEAQRMLVNQAEATRAAVELAEGKGSGPRRVDVVGGYAVVDAQGSWIFVETTRDGVRIVAAGLGTTFLEGEGDAISFAQPGGVPCSLGKFPGPPGTVMVADGAERVRIIDVTPEQRDAIVAALAAPPGEVDIAALLAKHGDVRKPQ